MALYLSGRKLGFTGKAIIILPVNSRKQHMFPTFGALHGLGINFYSSIPVSLNQLLQPIQVAVHDPILDSSNIINFCTAVLRIAKPYTPLSAVHVRQPFHIFQPFIGRMHRGLRWALLILPPHHQTKSGLQYSCLPSTRQTGFLRCETWDCLPSRLHDGG